jgi:crotonobetainyl-CoA:carnitine CoA-transferase CaiB-like acyl-CoA transferase
MDDATQLLLRLRGPAVASDGARHASIAPYGRYRAGDGSTVFLSVQNDREWATLCRDVLGRPELVDDERFARNTERVEHNDETTPILGAAFATTTADRAVEVLDKPASPAPGCAPPRSSTTTRSWPPGIGGARSIPRADRSGHSSLRSVSAAAHR